MKLSRRTALLLPFVPAAARAAAAPLSFGRLYGPVTATGITLSPEAQALVGRRVTMTGFMAPPLKVESDVFVLTRFPMSTCPFCSNAADWPVDVVFVRLGRQAQTIEPSAAIDVTGTLRFGAEMDRDTGLVSLVRLIEAEWRRT